MTMYIQKREEWTGFSVFDLIAPFMDSLQVEKHSPAISMGRDSETLTTFWWGIRSGHPTSSLSAVKDEERSISVMENSPCLKKTSYPVTPTPG